jgi:hypothetical protein
MRSLASAIAILMLGASTASARPSTTRALRSPDRLRERVHVGTNGAAGFAPTTLTIESTFDANLLAEYVVVQRDNDVAQLVVDEDSARLLLWVNTADLAWTVTQPTQIFGSGASGVWLLPGAPITVDGAAAQVAVHFRGVDVSVDGTVARTDLTHWFVPTQDSTNGTDLTSDFAREPLGPTLVNPTQPLTVAILQSSPASDWVLVEHRDRYLRIVGWTRRDQLHANDTMHGSGISSAYAMSDTARVTVALGTCLFDETSDIVVGKQTATTVRYGYPRANGDFAVYVSTAWGMRTVIIHDRKHGVGKPHWRRCPS